MRWMVIMIFLLNTWRVYEIIGSVWIFSYLISLNIFWFVYLDQNPSFYVWFQFINPALHSLVSWKHNYLLVCLSSFILAYCFSCLLKHLLLLYFRFKVNSRRLMRKEFTNQSIVLCICDSGFLFTQYSSTENYSLF